MWIRSKLLAVLLLAFGIVSAHADGIINGGGGSGSGVTSVTGTCGGSTGPSTGAVVVTTVEPIVALTTGNITKANCGEVVNYNSASDQTPTIPAAVSAGSGLYFDFCNIGTHAQTLTPNATIPDTIGGGSTYSVAAGTAAAPICVRLTSDGVSNWAIVFPPGGNVTGPASATSGHVATYNGTTGKIIQDGGAALPASANPSATAGAAAVNGTAATFMTSDSAPPVAKGTNSTFGIFEVDNATITAPSSVLTGAATTINKITCTPGSTCIVYGFPGPSAYTSGNIYLSPLSQQTAGGVVVASTVYCSPFIVSSIGMTIKGLAVDITTLHAGGHLSIALFSPGANGLPSTLVDYISSVLSTGATGAIPQTLHGTTDVLTPGYYWTCYTTDDTTVVVEASNSGAPSGMINALVGNATGANIFGNTVLGVSCTAASTCGTGYSAWSAGAFSWASFSSPTFANVTTTTLTQIVGLQAN